MKKNLVYKGAVILIVGLILTVLTEGTYEVKVQDLSIEKKDGYYAFLNNLKSGEEFTAEFVCHQPKGGLRMVLITASWYDKWRGGQDIPNTELLGDAYGHQGKIAWKVQTDGAYYLVLSPTADTAGWPFDVSVKLESRSERGVGWLIGMALLLCGIAVMILGFGKKKRMRHYA